MYGGRMKTLGSNTNSFTTASTVGDAIVYSPAALPASLEVGPLRLTVRGDSGVARAAPALVTRQVDEEDVEISVPPFVARPTHRGSEFGLAYCLAPLHELVMLAKRLARLFYAA